MLISKLGPNRGGREFAGRVGGGGSSLSRQELCEMPVAKNGGKRGEAGGKSQEKVQVTLFFFLETNSGWTQGDARQFTKSQALLSHFSKPCNLETGPQPTIASSSQSTLFNLLWILVKFPKCLLLPSTSFFLLQKPVPNSDSHVWNVGKKKSRRKRYCLQREPLVFVFTCHGCECSDGWTKWRGFSSITSKAASKLCSQIRLYWIFCFISSPSTKKKKKKKKSTTAPCHLPRRTFAGFHRVSPSSVLIRR